MRHPGYMWIESEDRGSKTLGEVEITERIVSLRVGESVVAEWEVASSRLTPLGDDAFRLESGADAIFFSPLDLEQFRADASGLEFRSRLARSGSAPPVVTATPVPSAAVPGPPIGAKNPGVAAVLSFLWAGLGQIYNGEIGKGIAIMIVQAINLLLAFFFIGIVTGLGVLVWAVFDAYQVAERHNVALASGGVG